MPDSDPSALVIAFGKYRGLTVAELLAKDPSYAQWLLGQAWLADRFAELHAALANRGAAQDDTPEHNLIQARFTHRNFRVTFLETVFPDLIDNDRLSILDWNRKHPRDQMNPPFDTPATAAQFEVNGIDVLISWSLSYPTPQFDSTAHLVSVEIKPSLGDDYPAVMRQIQRLKPFGRFGPQCLLIDSYAGRTIPYPQLRDMFQANGVRLVTLREIQNRMPPEFPPLPT